MVFNFDTVNLGQTPGNWFLPIPFDNNNFERCLTKWQKLPETTGAWTTVFLENHHQGRSVSRFESDLPEFRERVAKMLATLLATMTGTLFLYQGQEIGMINGPESWSANEYKFTNSGAVPWMTVLDNYREINVSTRLGNKNTVLEHWREILKLRRKYSSLFVYGTFTPVNDHQDLLAFIKTDPKTGAMAMTVANLSQSEVALPKVEGGPLGSMQPLMTNYAGAVAKSVLGPYEARVYLMA
ncbi:hypothetical protein FOIG_13796 [Fusarium odoratissimum NRRL 54006]|nr:uncharacterized protein FOIG_13796 [Fusarium odoratissimum NRRL 54006]EXL93148.1 hypothetical protein FOIG_13796 [Fusarium odoratissimum NRRL 54006]